jgi:hypothetical protein
MFKKKRFYTDTTGYLNTEGNPISAISVVGEGRRSAKIMREGPRPPSPVSIFIRLKRKYSLLPLNPTNELNEKSPT